MMEKPVLRLTGTTYQSQNAPFPVPEHRADDCRTRDFGNDRAFRGEWDKKQKRQDPSKARPVLNQIVHWHPTARSCVDQSMNVLG